MREKILSLAKGNFIYETPKLCLSIEKLVFEVTAGTHGTASFLLENSFGTRVKGFGTVEEMCIDFLPFFDGTKNELTVDVDAGELNPGEKLKGNLDLITDCGEEKLPYEITIVSPVLRDEEGEIRDYPTLKKRIEKNPEHGVDLFLAPEFRDAFLYRDESGRILYDCLLKKNTKLQSLEEFLVAMKKKKAIRFETEHPSGRELIYELDGTDKADAISIRVNTWGHAGIHVRTTADFIEVQTHVLWTDEFVDGRDVLEFTICADKVPAGRRHGDLILQTPYEKKVIHITAHNRIGEKERKIQRARKKAIAMAIRMFLSYQEKRVTREAFGKFLKKNREILEKISGTYEQAVRGYIAVILREKENILSFFQETENLKMPPLGESLEEVENYILIQFIKIMDSERKEDRIGLANLISSYAENGYQSDLLTYLLTQVDERYRFGHLLEKDLRTQLESGSNSPLLYSAMMLAYREDATLISSLDDVTINAVNYGLKRDLTTKEVSLAVSFLGERLPHFDARVFSILQKLYEFFVMTDTIHGICGMLIRNEIRDAKYFSWFEKGVNKHLRLTDLYEYYMYTIDTEKVRTLPDAVLSYFQYENHLNDRCKAFLYAYLVKHAGERPEVLEAYGEQIHKFVERNLAHHRITEDLALLYEACVTEETLTKEMADDLSEVMFSHRITCGNDRMDGVAVVHRETKEQTYYSFENGQAVVSLYTPNTQLFFVDERGLYYSGTVDYRMEKMLSMEKLAPVCYELGARNPKLITHLAYKAERSAKMTDMQALVLQDALQMDCLRRKMREKILLCLYDYYHREGMAEPLFSLIEQFNPITLKRERIADVAADCIAQGKYEKAQVMLLRYGVPECDKNAFSTLVEALVKEHKDESEPMLVKWALYLYHQGCAGKDAMKYLRRYYTGDLITFTSLYEKCRKMPEVGADEDITERLLAQVLFVGASQEPYEPIYLEYMESGENRMLVKAFLSQLAYDYVVERQELSEPMFVKIEKEAMYEKDAVMVLAALRHYRLEEHFASKQKEFVEMNLEKFASEGTVFAFMKDYIGKVNVPFEIENTVIIQYYSGAPGEILLCETDRGGKVKKTMPMRQVFSGVYVYEMLLFDGEEKYCYIEEQTTGERTEVMCARRTEQAKGALGFFRMLNDMIAAKNTGDMELYGSLRRRYEKDRFAAKKLFTLQ